MLFFFVVLISFGFLRTGQSFGWIDGQGAEALPILALGIGFFCTGIEHFVIAENYERMLPLKMPQKRLLVYASALLRVLCGIGVWFSPTCAPSVIMTLVLLILVVPVNVRVAVKQDCPGALLSAPWYLWFRVLLHAGWLAWTGWCCVLLKRI